MQRLCHHELDLQTLFFENCMCRAVGLNAVEQATRYTSVPDSYIVPKVVRYTIDILINPYVLPGTEEEEGLVVKTEGSFSNAI
jgi:hypothetical protein